MSSSHRDPTRSNAITLSLTRGLALLLLSGCVIGLEPIVTEDDTGEKGVPFGGGLTITDTGITSDDGGSDEGSDDEGGAEDGGSEDGGSEDGGDGSGDSGGESGSDSGSGDSGSGDSGSGDSGSGDSSGSSGSGGSGGSTASSPILSALAASDLGGQVEVEFVAADADEDLIGGYFILDVDGMALHYDIASDLDSFSDGGTSIAYFDPGLSACESDSLSLSGHVEDASGLTSSDRSATVSATGDGSWLSETGDDSGASNNLGVISSSTDICGNLYSVVYQYGGDEDWLYFEMGAGGSWVFELTWDASSSDYDMYLFDGNTGQLLNSAITESYTPRETMTQTLSAGRTYYLAITAWEGSPGDYVLEFR